MPALAVLLIPILLLAACAGQETAVTATAPTATAAWPEAAERLALSDQEWRARLGAERYEVLRTHGTEAPFCGGYTATKHHGTGIYRCGGCGNPLFPSAAKFESGTGWPSFTAPIPGRVGERRDGSHGMVRIEVHCARCQGHLGHRFEDGPQPDGAPVDGAGATGQRYCINAVALDFQALPQGFQRAVFAAGCFWGVEELFRELPGVVWTQVGYTGGRTERPTYRAVCGHGTGHAEAVEVVFDPATIGYPALLAAFFAGHDPTQVDRQGPDIGDQYRSALFPIDPAQRAAAEAAIAALKAKGVPVATRLEAAAPFWRAEEYHQQYAEKNGVHCHRR